jgi:hypothetical protein
MPEFSSASTGQLCGDANQCDAVSNGARGPRRAVDQFEPGIRLAGRLCPAGVAGTGHASLGLDGIHLERRRICGLSDRTRIPPAPGPS